MPRSYKMSADTREEEKILGGILTAKQGGWLALGFGITAIGIVSLQGLIGPIPALIISAPPGIAVGGIFAFKKKEGLSMFQYLRLKKGFQTKQKVLLNTLDEGSDLYPVDNKYKKGDGGL